MSDYADANEFLSESGIDPESDNGTVKALRKKYENLIAVLKQKDEMISSFEQEKVQKTVEDTWSSLGVPAEARALYNGDASPEKITEWVNAAKALGVQFKAPEGAGTPAAQPTQPEAHPLFAQLQAANAASSLGTDPETSLVNAVKAKAAELKGKSAFANPNALEELFNLKP